MPADRRDASDALRASKSREGLAIEPITVPKAADVLADRLRELILSGQIQPGHSLPTERELVSESGLSRSSVREALRVLEVEGLIVTRAGRAGGSTVRLPGRGSVARSMGLFVKSHAVKLESLLECRLAVEPFLASRAAINRSEEDLQKMREIHRQFTDSATDVAAYKRLNLDWHLAVAQASGNDLLIALMEAIAEPIFEAGGYHSVTTPSIRKEAIRAHAAVMDAIETRNSELAFSRMQKHLSAYADIARRKLGRSNAIRSSASVPTGSLKRQEKD